MNRHETEHDILHGAIEAFRAETALQLDVVEFDARRGNRQIDAILQMPGNGTQLLAEIKKWATHTNLGVVINQRQQLATAGAGLLVADYVNPNMAGKLREAGIQYIDAAGNDTSTCPRSTFISRVTSPRSGLVPEQKPVKHSSPPG